MFLTMFFGLFFIATGDVSAQNCVPKDNQIAVFKDWKYTGECRVLNVGDYANDKAMNFKNDAISSVKVGKNVKAMLCEHFDFRGVCQTFETNNEFLKGTKVENDKVSSVKVIAKNETAATKTFRISLVGIWTDGKEKLSFDQNKVIFQYVNANNPYNTSSYRVVNEKTVEFTDNNGKARTATMTIGSDNKTLTWHRPDQGKTYNFKRTSN